MREKQLRAERLWKMEEEEDDDVDTEPEDDDRDDNDGGVDLGDE